MAASNELTPSIPDNKASTAPDEFNVSYNGGLLYLNQILLKEKSGIPCSYSATSEVICVLMKGVVS